jgi:hypothetical protein
MAFKSAPLNAVVRGPSLSGGGFPVSAMRFQNALAEIGSLPFGLTISDAR